MITACAFHLAWFLWIPPFGDVRRFPPIPELRAAIDFNRRYRDHLYKMREVWPERRWELTEMIGEAECRHRVIDDAWGANPDYECSDWCKSQYLFRLRVALGPDAYRRAELPPPVPRFPELRR